MDSYEILSEISGYLIPMQHINHLYSGVFKSKKSNGTNPDVGKASFA